MLLQFYELETQVKKIFGEVFASSESTEAKIDWLTFHRGVPPWDSLKHVEILSRLEEAFQIQIGSDAAVAITSFSDILSLVPKLVALSQSNRK
jgi:acyl carrier protein